MRTVVELRLDDAIRTPPIQPISVRVTGLTDPPALPLQHTPRTHTLHFRRHTSTLHNAHWVRRDVATAKSVSVQLDSPPHRELSFHLSWRCTLTKKLPELSGAPMSYGREGYYCLICTGYNATRCGENLSIDICVVRSSGASPVPRFTAACPSSRHYAKRTCPCIIARNDTPSSDLLLGNAIRDSEHYHSLFLPSFLSVQY